MNRVIGLSFILGLTLTAYSQGTTIRVGAKHFNEGYILSEMLAQLLEDGGYTVDRKFNLGGTAVAFEALRTGAIDLYPEYTGTITLEILKMEAGLSASTLNKELVDRYNLQISRPYGFQNTYALLMDSSTAASRSITTISDLARHRDLRMGLSYEFTKRKDGWDNLKKHYRLPFEPLSLEHGLAYEALRNSKIDVTDAYSTDGEIRKYGLRLLRDDLRFFPEYEAVTFYRDALPQEIKALIDKLGGVITETEMQRLNALALFEKESHKSIAHDFLIGKGLIGSATATYSTGYELSGKIAEHLMLTLVALFCSIVVALPLGVFIYYKPRFAYSIVYVTGVMQTIPSIALLALMIPLVGIGKLPAIIALFFYALLPILRNTITGLQGVEPSYKKVAAAMGLSTWQQLRLIEIPLAKPMILAGIRTAAVINVGTATLAAFIGAGGLGDYIVTGLALNNTELILRGAIPSAILAIGMELLFELIESVMVLKHLRLYQK